MQGKVDWCEQIDIGFECEFVDDGFVFNWFIGFNFWFVVQLELKEIVMEWYDILIEIVCKFLCVWVVIFGVEEIYFDELFCELLILIKIVCYLGMNELELQQGVGVYKDFGVLMLLWVEFGKGGFQVECDGEWVLVLLVFGVFVVNIGELLEYVIGGYFKVMNYCVILLWVLEECILILFFFNFVFDQQLLLFEFFVDFVVQVIGVIEDFGNLIYVIYGENVFKFCFCVYFDVVVIYYFDFVSVIV